MVFIYLINKKQEVAFLYCAIATILFAIYFMDYLKFVYLPTSYLLYKKIFLSALHLGSWFYILAMSKFFNCFYLKYISGITAFSFILMSSFIDNFVTYKSFYQYWYLALLVNILIGFIYGLANLKKSRQAFIFVAGFLYLFVYASFAVLLEFFGYSFSINSPLVYIIVFAVLPLLFGFDEITNKEYLLSCEKEFREQEYINSITDSLTGIWNQRFLYSELKERSKDRSIAILDIDDFKEVNDTYGHPAGDYILKEFASLVSSMIRETDDLCRYGGDEFIIILYNCNQENLFSMMSELREKVKDHDFIFDGQSIKISISVGIYTPARDESFEEALKKADHALYLSKEKGKDTVSVFDYSK